MYILNLLSCRWTDIRFPVFFAKIDEKPYSNKTPINPSKLKYLQKFKGMDGGGKYLKFKKNA